ncbi:hypothetical protein BV20DRAFT_969115 [Pilatotrama ljubarskyi]|nr:hypothetical protein BV20DRAFT_969115 [Pilatotrama ljubarskyi]
MLASTDSASPVGSILLPLVKIVALVATGYAVHRALSPPNPPPSPKTCIDNRTLFERAIRHVTFCSKVSVSDLSCSHPVTSPRSHPFDSRPALAPRERGEGAGRVQGTRA